MTYEDVRKSTAYQKTIAWFVFEINELLQYRSMIIVFVCPAFEQRQ
jgi:hypothetical protein